MAFITTEAELIELYNKLYANIENYGRWGERHTTIVSWMVPNIPPGASVLDAGCGRGDLVKKLIEIGYNATGTEVAECLFEEGGELATMPALQMSYSELDAMPKGCYEVVISCDVLEHLLDIDMVEQAVRSLVDRSKRYVLFSVGYHRAGFESARCSKLGILQSLPGHNLHTFQRPPEWWKELFDHYLTSLYSYLDGVSYFFFGEKKAAD